MIVPVNSEKYSALFADANQVLDLSGDNAIDNLHEYYTHMKDFYNKGRDGYRFIMMPLNEVGEQPFAINLNNRSITIPESFTKVGAVQSD